MRTEFNVTERTVSQGHARQAKRVTSEKSARPSFLEEAAALLHTKLFTPHPKFTSGHAQTLAGYCWPRGFLKRAHRHDQPRLFEVEPDVRLLAHCRWQKARNTHPTLVLVHGLEGSNTSIYMLGTAEKAYGAGFNVVRLNLRTCGETEHLTPTLYNAALAGDLRAVLNELILKDGLTSVYMAGFSMGGNMCLLLAGEDAPHVPQELKGVCAVSPTIDLRSCAEAIERRDNWLYKQSFMRSMRKRVRRKRKFFPELYDTSALSRVRTIRDFDQHYTVVYGGFNSVDEYYQRASSLPLLSKIRTPTLMVQAQDDPFVPFYPFNHPSIAENPYLIFLAPEHGGHVGF
ncbi:MAG TPA: alpha/beta fold hydrolase, partial [Pyrinomonadaceae bacterium]|nr:alpha/beta fold hydrolase [Pyrinomonadaceae bacterium]